MKIKKSSSICSVIIRYKDNVAPTLCEVHPDNGVIEPDDNLENMKANYLPWIPQGDIIFHTLHTYHAKESLKDYRPVILLKRVHLKPRSSSLNRLLRNMCSRFCYKVSRKSPCSVIGLDVQVRLPGEDVVEICLTAMIAYNPEVNSSLLLPVASPALMDTNLEIPPDANSLPIIETGKKKPFAPSFVFLTPLMTISGYHVKKYCGLVVLHFIREGSTSDEQETINNYNHKFLLEVLAVTKAHVRCIGGNALLSFHILPQETAEEDVQKAYNMITIAGDAAFMEEDYLVCLKNILFKLFFHFSNQITNNPRINELLRTKSHFLR